MIHEENNFSIRSLGTGSAAEAHHIQYHQRITHHTAGGNVRKKHCIRYQDGGMENYLVSLKKE